jgi:ABC-2 type transport system ATP-binding protein
MIFLRNIRKTFGPLVAVDDLSLDIHAGEVFGLLGPNGAGKSTTISMVVGLLKPDAGQITVAGGDPADPSCRARIGIAPQALAIYEELTARENLLFFASLYGMPRRQRIARSQELLALMGLADRGDERVKRYSGGMQRRVNLACALVHDPTLVLLDEPTAGVDPQSRNAIFEIVRMLQSRGRTVVYITHYMEEVQQLCGRAAIIDHGRLLALDTVDGLIKQHGGDSVVRVVRASGEQKYPTGRPLEVLEQVLAARDALAVHIDRADLGTVFLKLTGRELRD